MSNYYENGQSCQSCISTGKYVPLKNTTDYECDHKCSCRYSGERSTKDMMYYQWFVLNKPIILPKKEGKIQNSKTC